MSDIGIMETARRKEAAERVEVPVVEVFGPTVQGEGPLAGCPTYFIRIAGCDYRCEWCDSAHAVLPKLWRGVAEKLNALQMVERVQALPRGPGWVTISGGNPALYRLDGLVTALHEAGYLVALETQGSRWRPWMTWVDMLVLSPKPPSSGMAAKTASDWPRFISQCVRTGAREAATAVKVVVFTEEDYQWALDLMDDARPTWMRYLSLGTPVAGGQLEQLVEQRPARSHAEAVGAMADGYHYLCERVANDPRAASVRVLPQLHVLAWGDKTGV